MDLHMDAHRSIPIRRPGAEARTDLIERAGLPWGPARPRELDDVSITPNAVARAIEDLQRSGYRPLHVPLIAPEPSSIPRARAAPGTTCETEKRQSSGRHPLVEEDVS